jgi:hypothetical protein
MSTNPFDVFLSYKSDDAEIVEHHPDAFRDAHHDLGKAAVKRLQHYFTIPKTFCDGRTAASSAEKEVLHQSFAEVWMKVQRELLRTYRRNHLRCSRARRSTCPGLGLLPVGGHARRAGAPA